MANITNLFSDRKKDEMDLTRNLMAFLKSGGYETFIDFIAEGESDEKVKKNLYLEKHAEDEDNLDYEVEESVSEGRLDGVVKSDPEGSKFVLVIESKRWHQADERQLKQYLDSLDSEYPGAHVLLVSMSGSVSEEGSVKDDRLVYRTWKGLVKHLEEVLDPKKENNYELGEKETFVIDQFKKYLEERGYGMYKFNPNVQYAFENEAMRLEHPFRESINSQLDNYVKLAGELAVQIQEYYSETRGGKKISDLRNIHKPKPLFTHWSVLMHVWYEFCSAGGGSLLAKLDLSVKGKSYIFLNQYGKELLTNLKQIQAKPHFTEWTEENNNKLMRTLKSEEVKAILEKQFDSPVFKTFLEDYSLMLDELFVAEEASS